jgi:hypothetical protein
MKICGSLIKINRFSQDMWGSRDIYAGYVEAHESLVLTLNNCGPEWTINLLNMCNGSWCNNGVGLCSRI